MLNYCVLLFFALCLVCPAIAQDKNPPAVKEGDILPYLEQVIAWNRAIADTETLPDNAREILLKDRMRQNAKKATQKSFDFARAQNAVLKHTPSAQEEAPVEADSRKARLAKAVAETDQKIEELQIRLKDTNLDKDGREKLQGNLRLVKAQQNLLQTLTAIFNAEGDNSDSLLGQINALSRTVLDESQEASPTTKEDGSAKTTIIKEDVSQNNEGMLKLSTSMFSFSRKKSEIDNLINQTKVLADTNRAMIGSIRAALKSALAEGNALSSDEAETANLIASYKESIDSLIIRYKQLAAALIPLGEMNVLLSSEDRSLQEWSRLLNEDWNHVLRQLVVRLVILSVAVAIPLLVSGVARRAIKRYVKDPKRQRLLSIMRRIILGIVLTFVILANFLTEFGSLATFAGFITAGLAVALQTVLVSLVAHFFFFGRYGVRAGDRVTISDVTGEVMQVGMLRLYIRQLKDSDGHWVPTGKMVAFPNSILFQPAAFYKHIDDGRD